MLAVTGATGQLGRLVIAALKARGLADRTVALVRDTAKAADLGVPARPFDYSAPETLIPALAGVEKLLLISSSTVGQRVEQHRNVVVAAREAGIGQILYTSLLHADTSEIVLAREHVPSEEAIRTSGIPFVLLRNGWYTENYTGAVGTALANGAMIGSAGEGKLSLATRADFAEAAAAVLAGDGHAGRTYELAGDEAVTMAEIAAEIARQSGKDVIYRDLPEAEYAAALESFGVPAAAAAMLASSDAAAARGALFDDSRTLSRLIGRPTTPLSRAVADALAAHARS